MIVVDANILAYLYLGGGHGLAVEALLKEDEEWAAPSLWRSEMRNTLAGCLRRGDLGPAEALSIQSEAENLMGGAEYEVSSGAVLELVAISDCTAYDCEYVAVAIGLGVRLVTMDAAVLKAFPDVAVPLVG